LFQAEATLNSLIENSPLDKVKEDARKKLKEIEVAKKEELVTERDTIQSVDENTEGNEIKE
jgi:hypothetical protein